MEDNANAKEFNPEASLKVIYEMIESTKEKIGKNYFYFLFWGYLVALTCIIEYLLIAAANYPKHYLVWPVFMFVGAGVTLLFYLRGSKLPSSKSFIGVTMGFLWFGWFICTSILIVFINLRHDYNMILPVIMAMYGLATFISGGVVKFRPLLIGAVIAWIASVFAFFAPYEVQLIIMTGVVIISYIIPGHMLRIKSKS